MERVLLNLLCIETNFQGEHGKMYLPYMERFNFAVKNTWSEVHSNSNINFIGSLCPKATQQSSGEFILNDTAKKGNSKGAFIY